MQSKINYRNGFGNHNISRVIKKKNTPWEISYAELLSTWEWQGKRNNIIKRDDEICSKCHAKPTVYIQGVGNWWFETHEEIHSQLVMNEDGYEEVDFTTDTLWSSKSDKPYHLHVHHKYYTLNALPWEYPDSALITLCNWCHWEFHKNNRVPVYESVELHQDLEYEPCRRCKKAGIFPEYTHVLNGIYFRCNGVKYEELINQ